MQFGVSGQRSTAIGYLLAFRNIGSIELLQFLVRYPDEGCNGIQQMVRALYRELYRAVRIGFNPLLGNTASKVLAGNGCTIDRLAILGLDSRTGVQDSRENRLDGIAALHGRMIVVLAYHIQQVHHIAWTGHLFRTFLMMGDGVDEVHQLLLPGIVVAGFQLPVQGPQDGVLVRGIAEDGSVILFQLHLKLLHKLEVGVFVWICVQVLVGVADGSIGLNDVVGELEGHLLVGTEPYVQGQGHGSGLKVNHMQRVHPSGHLFSQAFNIHIDTIKNLVFEWFQHLLVAGSKSYLQKTAFGRSKTAFYRLRFREISFLDILKEVLPSANEILLDGYGASVAAPELTHGRLGEVVIFEVSHFLPALLPTIQLIFGTFVCFVEGAIKALGTHGTVAAYVIDVQIGHIVHEVLKCSAHNGGLLGGLSGNDTVA